MRTECDESRPYGWRMAQKNVNNQSQKRVLKILQIERKTEIKRWFLPLRVVVFRFFGGQSIAFRLSKQPFYTPKAALLACKSITITS